MPAPTKDFTYDLEKLHSQPCRTKGTICVKVAQTKMEDGPVKQGLPGGGLGTT